MFDNDVCSVDELKSTIVKNLMKSWEESKRKEYQVISFQVDRGSEIAALTTILKEVKGAFEQIRADFETERSFYVSQIEQKDKKRWTDCFPFYCRKVLREIMD